MIFTEELDGLDYYEQWIEKGGPSMPVRLAVRRAAELIRRLNEVELSGGIAHIVAHDENVRDEDIAFCLEEAEKPLGPYETQEGRDAAAAVLRALEPMSIADRCAAVYHGWEARW